MKLFYFLFLALTLSAATWAQSTNITYSDPFEEPEDGWCKLLQLGNGNTFFFHFLNKKGMEVKVYDAARKLIAERQITSKLWDPRKMSVSGIEGLYEMNGQPVIFLHQTLDRTPTLFRIVLNAATGAVEEDAQIATLPRYKAGSAWAMAYGAVQPADFIVEKDPNSDQYAVINFNTFASESDERIELKQFDVVDGKHRPVKNVFYDAQGYKFLNFIGMVVDKSIGTFVCTYGYNTQKSGGKDSRVIVSKIGPDGKEFTHKHLEFSDDFKDTKAIMKYNSGSGMIQLLTLTYLNAKGGFFSSSQRNYMALMSYIDPQSLFIIATKPLPGEKINEFLVRKYNYEKGLSLMPQDMIVNKDNSTTVLSEEIVQQITYTNTGAIVSASTILGAVGLTELDTKGAEEKGMAIVKAHIASGIIDAFYVAKKSKGQWSYKSNFGGMNWARSNAFLSFDYVNTEKNKYVLLNDYASNVDADDKDKRKRKPVAGISNSHTICYKVNYAGYDKTYLFGKPEDGDHSNFSYLEGSHFDLRNDMYATMVIQNRGKKKEAKIAWINFE